MEPDFSAVELVAQLGEPILGEVVGLDLEARRDQLERAAATDQLLNRLSDRRRLVVVGEAQNLNRDCFEYLRHLHDDPATRFALLFDGGDGCWEVLAREPMLRSRIYRRLRSER